MKSKWIVFLFLLLACCLTASAQDTIKLKDRVITTSGKVYEGQITDDQKGDYLIITTASGANRTIAYKDIAKIQYRINDTGKDDSESNSDEEILKKKDDNGLVTFDGYRASSHVTDKLVKKRNLGIGLTVAGMGLIAAGIALAVATSSQTQPNGYGGTMSSPGIGTLAGIVMVIGGVGITIPGATLWGKYGSKIRKAQQTE